MQPSRIAKDLMASGMDSSIHLAIAQESLRSLQDAVRDLPVILRDHDELLPLLLQQSFEIIGEKEYESLVKDIYSMQEAVKHAPRTIAQLQVDIEILMQHLETSEENSHQKSCSIQEGGRTEENSGDQRRSSV